jgi:hypothetical protein
MSQRELIAFGEVDPVSLQQLERCLDASGESSRGVLCADHHKGYSMPIGGVVASNTVVMPAGVGYDIGCGNCAVQTPIRAADLDVSKAMNEIWRTISFGMGQKNDERMSPHAAPQLLSEIAALAVRAHDRAEFRSGTLALLQGAVPFEVAFFQSGTSTACPEPVSWGLPPLAGRLLTRRADTVWRAAASASVPVLGSRTGSVSLALELRWEYTRHRSNDAFYRYDANALGVGISATY